jgi:hypothetical protein
VPPTGPVRRLPSARRPGWRLSASPRGRPLLPRAGHTWPGPEPLPSPGPGGGPGLPAGADRARNDTVSVPYCFRRPDRNTHQVSSMDTGRTGCRPRSANAATSLPRLRSVPSGPPVGWPAHARRSAPPPPALPSQGRPAGRQGDHHVGDCAASRRHHSRTWPTS